MDNTYKKHLLPSGSTIKDALKRLDSLAKDAIIFITDPHEKLIGSLTDGDVRRGLLKGSTLESKVDDIIHRSPRFIRKGDQNIDKVIEYRENNFKIIPVLNKNDRVINVVNFRELKSYLPVDAVIMAGGRGERLRPLTDSIPKPLLKVGGKPILEHNIDRLRLFGVDDFWITLRYMGEQIENHFGNGRNRNIKIKYLYEKEPLGTIGAVSLIKDFQHNYVLVTNSDLLTNINYELFFLDFIEKKADFSVVTIPYNVDIPYAVLETNNGHILNFREKPTYTYYSNGGIYLMKKEVLSNIPIEKHFNATDLMEVLIKSDKKVIPYPFSGHWLDIGRHEDFERAQQDIKYQY